MLPPLVSLSREVPGPHLSAQNLLKAPSKAQAPQLPTTSSSRKLKIFSLFFNK